MATVVLESEIILAKKFAEITKEEHNDAVGNAIEEFIKFFSEKLHAKVINDSILIEVAKVAENLANTLVQAGHTDLYSHVENYVIFLMQQSPTARSLKIGAFRDSTLTIN